MSVGLTNSDDLHQILENYILIQLLRYKIHVNILLLDPRRSLSNSLPKMESSVSLPKLSSSNGFHSSMDMVRPMLARVLNQRTSVCTSSYQYKRETECREILNSNFRVLTAVFQSHFIDSAVYTFALFGKKRTGNYKNILVTGVQAQV